jgi:hypothetical protein
MTSSREPSAVALTPSAKNVARVERRALREDALPPGEVFGGRYRVVELVGRGGQGDVYRAEDIEVKGHVVAVKLLHEAARDDAGREHAMRELRMLAAVSHPAILQFKDSGWYGGRLFFVMPWLEGKTLDECGRISRMEARRIFESVAAGVAALHAKGVRHQDIKPDNIFLAKIDGFEESMPVLLDLGVAASDGDVMVAGSPDYFAPELAASWPDGSSSLGPSGDVYALALTLRNALDPEGAPSLDVFSKPDLERRARVPVSPPRGRDLAYLRSSFERWLSIDPERRPTAEQLLRELEILTAPEDRRGERIKTLRRAMPFIIVILTLVGVIGVWARGELLAREQEAARAEVEQRIAEAQANEARQEAETARDAEREALARAARSTREADELEEQARSALGRARTAREMLERANGDRTRLEQAFRALQSAFEDAERARVSERTARETERSESERAMRMMREMHERERQDLTTQRDRALVAIGTAESRTMQAEARLREVESRAQAFENRAQVAERRASQLERRVTELESRHRRTESPEEPSPSEPEVPAERDLVGSVETPPP